MGLYVAICLLAALIAVPADSVEVHAIQVIWGITLGLATAHWFAFRVSARLVSAGKIEPHDAASAAAQLGGAAGVAVLATIPVILVPHAVEVVSVEILLIGVISTVGFAVARLGGATVIRAVLYALFVLVIAGGVAALKNRLAGH